MKQWWRRWTCEVPLAIGDALWEVLVVQLAAMLDRLTVRKVIAFIDEGRIAIVTNAGRTAVDAACNSRSQRR